MKHLTAIALLALVMPSTPCFGADFSLIVDTFSHHTAPPPSLNDFSANQDVPDELLSQFHRPWNEHNRALGIEYRLVDGDAWDTIATVARYTDSQGRDTWYAGAGWMRPLYARGDFTVSGGAYLLYFRHREYRERLSAPGWSVLEYVAPADSYVAPLPGLSFEYKHVGANFTIIPPIGKNMPWTAALQLKINL